MFRKILITVLAMGYLAMQTAAVPHAHANQPADHESRPHVHWDWFCFGGSSTDGGHDEIGHVHRHVGLGHSHEPKVPAEPGVPVSGDHDAGCYYVPVGSQVLTASWSNVLPVANAFATFDSGVPAVLVAAETHHVLRESGSDPTGDGCALILKLRTLRI